MRFMVGNHRTGELLVERAVRADNPLTRMQGLLGKRSLPADEAIILEPANSIHTMFMLFSIDVLFLDSTNTVLKVVGNLKPFRFSAARGARKVIEMKAHRLDLLDVKVGDQLSLDAEADG